MFESIEIRKVANGFILAVTDEDSEIKEYVYDSSRKAMRVIKQYIEAQNQKENA
mgnify:CR=1 FL=1